MKVVLDIGGGLIRAGFAGNSEPRLEISNCLARGKREKRVVTGDKISSMPSYLILRPLRRGIVTDWESLKLILDLEIFCRNQRGGLGVVDRLQEISMFFTMTPFAPDASIREAKSVFLEDFKIKNIEIMTSSICALFSPGLNCHDENPCALIVDCGFSGFRCIPIFEASPISGATQRGSVGGRVMINFLKELLSFTQVDLEDTPLLVQRILEISCFVTAKNEYPDSPVRVLLPDYSERTQPVIMDDLKFPGPGETVVKMNRERWVVPEILFNPEISGIKECGIAEAAARAIFGAPEKLRHLISRKIILCGGCVNLPGFKERFLSELESEIPQTWKFQVFVENDGRADLSIYRGAVALAGSDESLSKKFSRLEYLGM